MAISYVGDAENSAQNGGNVTVDLTGIGLAEKDVLQLSASIGSNAGESPTLALQEAGWTVLYNDSHEATDRIQLLQARKIMGATPDTTVTSEATDSDTDMGHAVVVRAYRGVDQAMPEDATTTIATGDDGQPNSPTITAVTNNSYCLSLCAKNTSDNAVTVPSGYGNFQQDIGNDVFDTTVSGADRLLSTGGAEDPGAWSNYNNGGAWIALSVALRPESDAKSGNGALAAAVATLAASGALTVPGNGALVAGDADLGGSIAGSGVDWSGDSADDVLWNGDRMLWDRSGGAAEGTSKSPGDGAFASAVATLSASGAVSGVDAAIGGAALGAQIAVIAASGVSSVSGNGVLNSEVGFVIGAGGSVQDAPGFTTNTAGRRSALRRSKRRVRARKPLFPM